jgi:hypothetical protein
MAVVLILNPRQDETFAELAHELATDDTRTPEALQAALRARYPSATVRPRILAGEPEVVWYVYRDGHWTSD